jgi:hypothetical protein
MKVAAPFLVALGLRLLWSARETPYGPADLPSSSARNPAALAPTHIHRLIPSQNETYSLPLRYPPIHPFTQGE